MKNIFIIYLPLLYFILPNTHAQITWTYIPQIRTGQIESITALRTPKENALNITDITFPYNDPFLGASISDLQTGTSLISYQSWVTDSFSFKIAFISYTTTTATIRFQLLDNTYFTKARTHYIVVWRTNSPSNDYTSTLRILNLQVLSACYLTAPLLGGSGTRDTTIGTLPTAISNSPTVVVKSMISGLQLINNQGINDQVKVTTDYAPSSNIIQHIVEVENNNFLTFVCLTTIVFDTSLRDTYYLDIVEYSTIILNATNDGLTNVPYQTRFDGNNTLFFGISEFNLSMSDVRQLNVQGANIGLVGQLYSANSAMNEVIYNMFFFASRSCNQTTTPYYQPITYSCVSSCPINSLLDNISLTCTPCHYSCAQCNTSYIKTGCTVCSASDNRNPTLVNLTGIEGECVAADGYVDVGVAVCQLCNTTMIGCNLCSSVNTCLDCIDYTIYVLRNNQCQCVNGTYMVSGYCVPFPGCLVARFFLNKIQCDVCDTDNNFTIVNYTCRCNYGYYFNDTTLTCYHPCGNGTAPNTVGKCDDGNLDPGDGCDSNCNVQNGYSCTFNLTLSQLGLPAPSTCKIKQDITIKYLYAQRYLNTNKFIMAFSLVPYQKDLLVDSFTQNWKSNLPLANQLLKFDTATSIIYFEGEYTKSIEANNYSVTITFTDIAADPITLTFVPVGTNARLIIEQFDTNNLIIADIIMGLGIYAVLLAILSSVIGLKLIGLQLLIPVQLIYFSLGTISVKSTYSFLLSNLRFVNGYNIIVSYDYLRTYSQSRNLVALNFQSQFLLSNNITLAIFMSVNFWLFMHHFRIKYKQKMLQKYAQKNAIPAPLQQQQLRSHESEQDKQDREQDEQKIKLNHRKLTNYDSQPQQSQLRQDHYMSFKRFCFLVDRIFFIMLMLQFNLIVFGFVIMSLNVPVQTFYFSEKLNVVVCTLTYFIFFGCLVYFCYDQQSTKIINFTCMNNKYAYVYILINAAMILTISMTFEDSYSIYLVTVLSLAFLALIIKQKPHNVVLLSFDNLVVLYLHLMLTVTLIILCLNSLNSSSEEIQLLQCYIITALILIGELLTTVRLVSRINCRKAFDDLKDFNLMQQKVREDRKVIQKNLDLLDKQKEEVTLPPDSVRSGLFTPRDRIVDWVTRNLNEYENIKSVRSYKEEAQESQKSRQNDQREQNQQKDQKQQREQHQSNLQILKEVQNHRTGEGTANSESAANHIALNKLNRQQSNQKQSEQQQLNQLQLLKKKLRKNLKLKKEAELSKKDK